MQAIGLDEDGTQIQEARETGGVKREIGSKMRAHVIHIEIKEFKRRKWDNENNRTQIFEVGETSRD